MKAEDIWKIWDEVIGVDVGIDPVPFAEAVLNAAPTGDIEHVAQVLACEIECSIFEQHVAPALEIALKALSPTQGADARPVAMDAAFDALTEWPSMTPRAVFYAGWEKALATRDATTNGNWPNTEIRNILQTLTLLCEESGEPCDGFRFRELVLQARKVLAAIAPRDKT